MSENARVIFALTHFRIDGGVEIGQMEVERADWFQRRRVLLLLLLSSGAVEARRRSGVRGRRRHAIGRRPRDWPAGFGPERWCLRL